VLKTHNCGELTRDHVGKKVTLAGWVHRRRDHGGLVFIDMRDRQGLVQVAFNPEVSKEGHELATKLRSRLLLRKRRFSIPQRPLPFISMRMLR